MIVIIFIGDAYNMRIATKTLKNGFEMPVYGLGTWRMGGNMKYDPDNNDEADICAIRKAIDLGITHIDTAEMYAEGHAEKLVGGAIKGHEREKLFIVTKVSPLNLSYDKLIDSAKQSLCRIKIDYLDLYLIHFPNKNIPIRETMEAMDSLVENGLVKNIGVSNFSVQQMEEAQSCAKNRIVATQLHMNLVYREPVKIGILDYCQHNDIMLIAYRPVQKGILTKKGVELVDKMCKKYRKTPAQIAINWLISIDNVVTLSKTRGIEHLKENLGALGFEMEQQDVDKLMKEFPDQQFVSDSRKIHKVIKGI